MQNQNSILIRVHSFCDSISNSSSESFVSATKQTVSTIREIIDSVLKISGLDKTTDDYFELGLVTEITELYGDDDKKVIKFIKSLGVDIGEYGECSLTDNEIKQVKKFIEKEEIEDSSFEDRTDESSEYPPTVNIRMMVKDTVSGDDLAAAKKVMKAVNGLMGTISAETRYC